ncbi:MAG TPA: MFS transporter [Candidatus Limnocylindrales bacterium]|nr:MFS transporter [Candidatus Limnocylindrales bacterium]
MPPPSGPRAAFLRGITRNVVALGVVSFLTDVSSELLVYVIPLYLANVLAATPTVIGLIEGIAESVAAFVKLASGAISDRIARRRALVGIGYGASVAAKALYLAAATWPVVLVARVGDRIGKGIRTAPRDALIADSTPADARGRAFGLHRAMDTAGAVVGVGLAAVIIDLTQGGDALITAETFRLLALAALVPGVLAVMVVALGVRDVPRPVANLGGRDRAAVAVPPAPGAAAAQPRGVGRFPAAFWIFVLATGLFTLGNSSDAFVALRSQSLGVGVRDLMLVVVAFNVVDALIAWPMGALSDRVGRRRLIALAWGLYALAYAGFALAGGPDVVIWLWLLYGAYYGVNEAVGRALVADLARPEQRATAYGIVNAVAGLAILPASVIAGLLWDGVGHAAPFWFGSACAALGVLLLAFVRPPRVTHAADALMGPRS